MLHPMTQPQPVARQREQHLLLACARRSVDVPTAERIRVLLDTDLDWEYVIQTATEHRVLPLVYHTLAALCPEAIPAEQHAGLRQYAHLTAQRNLFLMGELIKILRLFEAQGIAAVPYKGPVLATAVYGNLALREFCDLDILMYRRDAARARALLLAHGYEPYDHPAYAYQFMRDGGNVVVELHWQAVGFASSWQNTKSYSTFPLDLTHLWGRLETIRLAGMPVRSLAREDLLLVLCVHGSKHYWAQLGWICDVAQVLQVDEDIDWEALMARAVQFGGARMLLLGLSLAHNLLDAPLPAPIRQRIRDDTAVLALTAQVRQHLFAPTCGVGAMLRELPLSLQMRERWHDRMALLVHYLIVYFCSAVKPGPKDKALVALPRPLAFLHYLLRPLRLFGEYALTNRRS